MSAPVTATAARQLDVLLSREQVTGRLPSLVGGVVRDGSLVWTGSVGGLDGFDPGPDVQYRIGSITKTLVAVLMLQLRDEGALDLNDRLDSHLPGIGYGDRTLRGLLAHAAGLHSEPRGPWWERTAGASFDELAAALDDTDPAFSAGETFHYTNVAYGLLGEVVARHRGTTWWEAASQRILEPLGMTRTTYLPQMPHATGYSVHHFAGTLSEEPAHDAGAMAPAGQVWSTVADLGRYAAFLAAGRDDVLPRATLEEMSTPQSGALAAALGSAHGLGFQLLRGGSGMLVGHTGSMPGFLAGLFVDRVRRTGAVVVANGTAGLRCDRLPVELLESLESSEGTLLPAWTPNREVPAAVEEILGVWHWGNTAFAFAWDGRRVVVSRLGSGVRSFCFVPQDDGTFLGTVGYHHGERLRVVRRDGTSASGDKPGAGAVTGPGAGPGTGPGGDISHLECATFIYTRVPYDPAAPIPS